MRTQQSHRDAVSEGAGPAHTDGPGEAGRFVHLKARHPRYWTAAQVEQLRHWYGAWESGTPLNLSIIAAQLGRSTSNVCRKARELGLTDKTRRTAMLASGYYRNRLPKYASEDERRAAQTERLKKLWQERPHPRGALGMKHSEETKRRLSEMSRERATATTPEQWAMRGTKASLTKLAKYGTAGPGFLVSENPYSRARGGKRADLDNRYFRSRWEANYARYLRWLKDKGEIAAWEYEPETFVFHGVTRGVLTYTPDFRVTENDGCVRYHEVKGWMDNKSKAKLARMAKFYPDVSIIVIGPDEYGPLRQWAGLIEHWEAE